jgi:hypothetical protein
MLVDDKKRTEEEKLSNFIENILPLDLMLRCNDSPILHHTRELYR